MWLKSFSAVLWGLCLSISLMLNMHHLSPFDADTKLLVGLLSGFTIWAAVMTYCFSRNTVKQASIDCGKVLVVSALINALFNFA